MSPQHPPEAGAKTRLSREKVNKLAHAIADTLAGLDEVDFLEDRNTIRLEARKALEDLLAAKFQAALFTTAVQVEHFLEIASARGKRDEAIGALGRMFIASIGPDCSATLRKCGIEPLLEPSHPKMGILVREAAAKYRETSR